MTRSRERKSRTLVTAGLLLALILPIYAAARPSVSADRPPNEEELVARMWRVRWLTQAINQYTSEHDGHFPPNPGATLANADKDARVHTYLMPYDEDKLRIPEKPTADWVNEHTSFVYLASGATFKSGSAQHVYSSALVVAHEKLAGHENEKVALAFADGHAELRPYARAVTAIDDAKRIYERVNEKQR